VTATATGNEEGMVGTIIGRNSSEIKNNKTVTGTAPTFADITMTSAGKAVENASARSIINYNGKVEASHVVEYKGTTWTNVE